MIRGAGPHHLNGGGGHTDKFSRAAPRCVAGSTSRPRGQGFSVPLTGNLPGGGFRRGGWAAGPGSLVAARLRGEENQLRPCLHAVVKAGSCSTSCCKAGGR